MNEIAQIRKLSLWIFFIPLIAINLCLIISQNPEFLEDTLFSVDMIGRSGFSIPYLDGSLSISRASRTFPQYLIFKPAMILTAIMLFYYWQNNNKLVNTLIFEIIAQGILVFHFLRLKNKLDTLINKKVLILKIVLVGLLSTVAILSLPLLIDKGNTHFKHALEWNYFVGVILFYLFSRIFWKRTT